MAAFLADSAGTPQLKAQRGFDEASARSLSESPDLLDLVRQVMQSGERMHLKREASLSETSSATLEQMRLHSLVLAPIRAGKQGLGALLLGSREHPLDEPWASVAGTLAAQIGLWATLGRESAKAEAAQKQYRALLARANDAVSLLDLEGRILEVNPRTVLLFGRTASEMVGKLCFEFVLPEDRDLARAEFARQMSDVAIVTKPIRCLRGDGAILEAEFSSVVIDLEHRCLMCTVRDVTLRRRAERRRAAQYAVVRILSEASSADDALGPILQVLAAQLGWSVGLLWRVEEDADTLRCAASWTAGGDRVEAFTAEARLSPLRLGDGIAGRVWQGARPLWITDLERADDLPLRSQALGAGLRAELAFPVIGNGQVLGIIDAYAPALHDLDRDFLDLLGALGREVGQFLVRRAAEHERDLARQRLAHLVSSGPSVIYSCVPGGPVHYMSPNVREHLGYDAEEFLRDPRLWLSGIHPDDRARVLEQANQSPHRAQLSTEYRFRHKDGSWKWMRDEARTVRNPEGKPVEVISCWTDITSRRETEQHLQSILDHAPILIYAKDTEGRYIFANRQFEEATGLKAGAMIGKTDLELFAPELAQAVRDHDRATLQANGPTHRELTLSLASGVRTLSILKFPLRDAAGAPRGVCGVTLDVTERKKAAEALRVSEEMFQQAQKMEAIGRLAGGVAHDFNNLLTVINGYSQMLIEAIPEEDPVRGNIEEILQAGQRASALTRQLLAFSRRQVLSPKALDLSAVVREMEKMLRRLIGEDVELATSLHPAPGTVLADPGQIEQVIMNLAVNARDAMPQGGRLLIRTSEVEVDQGFAQAHPGAAPGRYVLLEVADTGHGMGENVRAHLFEPFFTTKEKGKGTGLGLSTVYGIVRQSGGHIQVDSELGKGTTFKMYFPRKQHALCSEAAPTTTPAAQDGSETVLLVEDDPCVRMLGRRSLSKHGYRVLEAADGEEALRISSTCSDRIDLLLTDVVMPKLGGLDLMERLRASRPEMQILLMSGYTERSLVECGAAGDTVGVVEKPFTVQNLLAKVRQTLDRSAKAEASHQRPS